MLRSTLASSKLLTRPISTSFTSSSVASMPPPSSWLLIDTDAGVDDAIALCLAARLQSSSTSSTSSTTTTTSSTSSSATTTTTTSSSSSSSFPPFSLKAVTCSFGNTSLANVVVNCAKCLSACGAPPGLISAGASHAVDADSREDDASFFHGVDGLGDVADIGHDAAAVEEAHQRDGVRAIVSAAGEARAAGVPLKIVTIGPLTNLSLALRLAPEAFENNPGVSLVVMGGCGNGRGNATRLAEFNVYTDVTAAHHVFSSWPASSSITVIPWDLCVAQPLPWSEYDASIRNGGSSAAKFLSRVGEKVYSPAKDGEKRSMDGAVICDALAVCAAIDATVVACKEKVNVEVENNKESIAWGATVVDWGQAYDGVKRVKEVDWVTKIDGGKYAAMMRKAFK